MLTIEFRTYTTKKMLFQFLKIALLSIYLDIILSLKNVKKGLISIATRDKFY